MSIAQKQIERAAKIFSILDREPTRYSQLLIKSGLTQSPFYSTIQWLLADGLIFRPDRGLYQMTEKGQKFYESIKNGS